MSDIATALGPGRKLDSLTSFAPNYVTVRRAFDNLLVFPHLEVMKIEDTSEFNVLSLVIDGCSRFSGLSNIDIGLARKVISYDAAFSALVDASNIQLLVNTLQPVAQEYADHARAQSKDNLNFFADFSDYIAFVDGRIDSLDAGLAQLDTQIQAQSEALANKSIVTTLLVALERLFKLSTAEDADVQIAAILGVTVITILGSFESLFDDQFRLQKIISSLKGLRTRTQDLKTKFDALNTGLKTVSISSQSLLDVWDDVAARMGAITEDVDSVPAPKAQQLKNVWAKVATGANKYIDVLQRFSSDLPGTASASAVEFHRVITAKFNAIPKVPITAVEIRLHKSAAAHGHDALLAPCKRSHPLCGSDDEKVVETVLGPSAETEKRLKELADSTVRVIEQFDDLLGRPFLEQYKCKSPDASASDSDLSTVMNIYRQKYLKLQLDTLPVARNLRAYTELQTTLLPSVVPDAQAQGTDIPMSLFLATHTPVVEEYLEKATKLSERSTEVKNDLVNAVKSVKKLIGECEDNIRKAGESINELTEQRKMVLPVYMFLTGIGAFLAFTTSAFLPGGMLATLSPTGAFGLLTVFAIIIYGMFTTAIHCLNAAVAKARDIIADLETLLPSAAIVAKSLSSISCIWSDIATALTSLNDFYKILNGPTGLILLNFLRPRIIANWEAVQGAVDKYIKVVTKDPRREPIKHKHG